MAEQMYEIALDAKGRKAMLFLPLPITEADLDNLIRWCEYIRTLGASDGD